jgi:hypothetical protein
MANSDGNERPEAAFVLTDRPVPIAVTALEDERTPEGMLALGTIINGRVVARCAVPPEALEFIEANRLFEHPVALALAAQEEEPGLQCRLFAVVTIAARVLRGEEDEDEREPWAASVPSSDFDRLAGGDDGDGDRQAAVLLGHIVRFRQDRKHPDDLGLEAADVLATIVQGQVNEVVDKVLGDLLEGAGPGPA